MGKAKSIPETTAYVDVDYGQFCRNVQIGRTRNGGEPVSVFTESDGRIFLAVGLAHLHMPDMYVALNAAYGWVSGKVTVFSQDAATGKATARNGGAS